jgi:hypothetical protein
MDERLKFIARMLAEVVGFETLHLRMIVIEPEGFRRRAKKLKPAQMNRPIHMASSV